MVIWSSTFLLIATTAGVLALLALGLARAARESGLSRGLAPAVIAGVLLWLGVTAILARGGVLSAGTSSPPRWPLLPLIALATLSLLGQTPAFRRLLSEVPPWRPVALQTFRIGVELAFWRLHAEGAAPVQVTFEGRNIDAIVGLTAPAVAAGIAYGRIGPRLTMAWNLFGLTLLVNAIGTVATSAPGPLHRDWPGGPFAAIVTWPVIWIPAFLAPTGIFLHVVSLRQAIAAAKRPGAGSTPSLVRPDRNWWSASPNLRSFRRELSSICSTGPLRTTRSRRLNSVGPTRRLQKHSPFRHSRCFVDPK